MTTLSSLLSSPKLVFMDCDGVIFDTNQLKCEAFRYALDLYPEEDVEALVQYHMQRGGVSRYLKLQHFFEVIHPVADVALATQRALKRFAHFCEEGYAVLAPRAEAMAFAAHFGSENTYVVSGSDEAELQAIFKAQGIDMQFARVCGSPTDKQTHVKAILEAHRVQASECLFIGDGWGDFDCAQALNMPLIYLAEMSEWQEGKAHIASANFPALSAETWQEVLSAL